MQNNYLDSFSIYKVEKTNLYAAIPKQFLRFIRQYAAEYQGLSLVPADKLVKAILLRSPSDCCNPMQNNSFQQDIAINRLQFYSDYL